MRVTWNYAGPFKTIERAQDVLDDMWAAGEVGPLEEPRIERRQYHRRQAAEYFITLLA